MPCRALALLCLQIVMFAAACCAVAASPVPVTLGHAIVPLNGPWRFHIGDNNAWAFADFDDSSWETVDLTSPPGAHDADVGLVNYVAGWQQKAHPGYLGYAWYRLSIAVDAPAGTQLALSGPPDVDSVYQLYINGRLLGGIGDFSHATPTAYSIQPRVFQLPYALTKDQPALIAIRVFMGPWDAGAADAGGIHIAPAIGELDSMQMLYRTQWMETIDGYIVEIVEAFLFVILACLCLCLRWFDRINSAYGWMAAALVLLASYRANQAIYFWWQFESIHTFEWISYVLLTPLALGVWTMAWLKWFRIAKPSGLPKAVLVLTGIYVFAQCMNASWFYGTWPAWLSITLNGAITIVRLLFLLTFGYIAVKGMQQQKHRAWYALPSLILIAIGLFAIELSTLGVPGIWFPFGTGVSRAQFAYLAFDIAFAWLLLSQLCRYARNAEKSEKDL